MQPFYCILLAVGFTVGGIAHAEQIQETASLPEPLTLGYALSLADEPHPELERLAAEQDLANSEFLRADANSGINTSLEATARWVEPVETASNQSHNDSRLHLSIRKQLYDFGRTDALRTAGEKATRGAEWKYINATEKQRVTIMSRYFDVILADLEFIRDNEGMATQFVRLDKLRDRHSLGQVSDIAVREQQVNYEAVRRARYVSQARQRSTRARLALALNRPGKLPSTLATPTLPELSRKLPEVENLQQQALIKNRLILALRSQRDAAQARVLAARAGNRPVLRGEVDVYEYERIIGSRDEVRASVTLEIPLTTGGRVDAEVARYRAELRRLQAELTVQERDVRQQVLELWLQLDTLRIKREEMQALMDYRDLYLDRSRALYEMEVKTDLGDSMVRVSDAHLQVARTDFIMALTWARLDALLGAPIHPIEDKIP